MTPDQRLIQKLKQSNRLLKAGYLMVGVAALVAYSLASPVPSHAGPSDPNDNDVRVAVNKVGDAQSITAVDHERGFAVLIDEEGKINVIHRDGKVIVASRKFFSDQVDVKPAD